MRRLAPQCETRVRGKFVQRFAVRLALTVLLAALLGAVATLLSEDWILNRFARPRIEREFAAAHPGLSLKLAELHYHYRGNQMVCRDAAIKNLQSGVSCRFGEVTAKGVEWKRLLLGPRRMDRMLAQGEFHLRAMEMSFPTSHYEIRCARVSLSLPASKAVLENFELHPSVGDEEFFAASPFRRTRFRLDVPRCRFVELDAIALLQGKKCRARALEVEGGMLETIFNRDKPINPQARRRLTLRELLLFLKIPLEISQVKVTNGQFKFGQKPGPGRPPRFLSFDGVRLTAESLIYPAAPGTISPMYATAKLMNAGNLTLSVQVPLADPEFTFRYSGSLGAMDLTCLNPFLEIASHCRLKSGRLRELVFSAEAKESHVRGELRALYENFDLELLKRSGPGESELVERAKSFLVDNLVLRRTNLPQHSKPVAVGRIDYTRKPGESYLHFGWFALRNAILDVLGFSRYVKK